MFGARIVISAALGCNLAWARAESSNVFSEFSWCRAKLTISVIDPIAVAAMIKLSGGEPRIISVTVAAVKYAKYIGARANLQVATRNCVTSYLA